MCSDHSSPTLSIIIVSWNVRDLLYDCLNSVYAVPFDGDLEVIVIDSASTDDSAAMVAAQFPQVRLTSTGENIGYVRGNNIGLAQASGKYLLLLNPDTVIIEDALSQMATYLEAHMDVGIVGPHTLNSDGTIQSTRRRFPNLPLGLIESTWLEPVAERLPFTRVLLQAFRAEDIPDDATAEVDWVQGSALMAQRAVYEQIGGLDEGYAMYSEELDWCKRAALAGWKTVYLGIAHIVHHGGKSSEQAGARAQIAFHQSKVRYFGKFHGRGAAALIRAVLLANYAVQWVIEGAKYLLGHKRALRRQRLATYAEVLRSRLRPLEPASEHAQAG